MIGELVMENLPKINHFRDLIKTLNIQIKNKQHGLISIEKQLLVAIDNVENLYLVRNKLKTDIENLVEKKIDVENKLLVLRNQTECIVSSTVKTVVKKFGVVPDINRLDQCIRYLIMTFHPILNPRKPTTDELIKLGPEKIILKAHEFHNNILVMNNGPHVFFHTHDNYQLCEWDGKSIKCKCGSTCVFWCIEECNLLTDISLSCKNPIGYAKCSF